MERNTSHPQANLGTTKIEACVWFDCKPARTVSELERQSRRDLNLARRPVRGLKRLGAVRRIRIHPALNIERVERIHIHS